MSWYLSLETQSISKVCPNIFKIKLCHFVLYAVLSLVLATPNDLSLDHQLFMPASLKNVLHRSNTQRIVVKTSDIEAILQFKEAFYHGEIPLSIRLGHNISNYSPPSQNYYNTIIKPIIPVIKLATNAANFY